jgi:hypothetical protein
VTEDVFRYFENDFHETGEETPNDPKLSDTPERRGTCVVGGKVAVEAGAVTRRRVRCSAWLGDVGSMRTLRFIGMGRVSRSKSDEATYCDEKAKDRQQAAHQCINLGCLAKVNELCLGIVIAFVFIGQAMPP